MSTPKMMPGQEPYTPEEWAQLQTMISDACDAEEIFSLDELEEFARKEREKKGE